MATIVKQPSVWMCAAYFLADVGTESTFSPSTSCFKRYSSKLNRHNLGLDRNLCDAVSSWESLQLWPLFLWFLDWNGRWKTHARTDDRFSRHSIRHRHLPCSLHHEPRSFHNIHGAGGIDCKCSITGILLWSTFPERSGAPPQPLAEKASCWRCVLCCSSRPGRQRPLTVWLRSTLAAPRHTNLSSGCVWGAGDHSRALGVLCQIARPATRSPSLSADCQHCPIS